MSKPYDYDVVVIGAGIAGLAASVTANGLGKKVALVEKRRFGGNCSSFTCLPSKTLIRSGHVHRLIDQMERYGLSAPAEIAIGTDGVMPRIREVVQRAYEKDTPQTFEDIGIHAIEGEASFVDAHRITLNGHSISAHKFIIAAGTRPLVPPIPGLDDIEYLTNETVFQLDRLPKSLIVLGGGIDGLEFASAFGGLGIEVTIVEMASQLLGASDRELANLLLDRLQQEGTRILNGTKAVGFSRDGDYKVLTIERSDGTMGEVRAEAVLLTIGRKAELEGLSLDKAGIKYTPRGIVTNGKLQTSVSHIYACGDIVGPYQLASMAEYQGIIAATNALLPRKEKVNYANSVFVIFTEPTLGHVGLTEQQARQMYGDNIRVYRFDYAQVRRAFVDATEAGLAKFICDKRGKLLGAHILGEGAAEVIHEAQLLKASGKPLHWVHSVTHAYPTYAQALMGRAGQLAYLDHMSGSFLVKEFLRVVPGYENRLSLARQRLAETSVSVPMASQETRASEIVVTAREPFGKEVVVNASRFAGACLVSLPAELTDPDEGPILEVCAPEENRKTGQVILDFSAVEMINGLGASMLVKLNVGVRRRGQRLLAFGVSDHYLDVLKVTGLHEVISIYSSMEEAFEAGMVGHHEYVSPNQGGDIRDIAFWAKPVSGLVVPPMPPEAINRNMKGRRVVGPVDGFGQLWQKTYRLRVPKAGITPEDVIRVLKKNFPSFQPSFNRFYPSSAGIAPGEVVLIDSSTPGGPVSTGVMVLYADERSFTFITPQGHPESGWVTFSAFEAEGTVIAQILGLARANDPAYEAAFRMVGSKMQVKIWTHVLSSLATHLGVPAEVAVDPVCVDRHMQWSQASNLWYNAQMRTLLYMPLRLLGKPMRDRRAKKAHAK